MSIVLFDSHCHLQFPQYDADGEEVTKRTLAAGCGMICVGTDLEMSKKAVELAEKYDSIWATVGAHPNCPTCDVGQFEELAKHPKVVGIGEAGLDYYRAPEKYKQEKQQEVFQQFLELAVKLNKPLIIHCRNAYDDLLKIIEDWKLRIGNSPPRGVIHSFAGDFELAQKFLDFGLFLGLNGIITFTNDCNDMIAKVPLEKILIETDAPYLAPVPHRGKRNEPLFVEFVAKRVAEIKNISFEEVVEKTKENAIKLFKLNEKV